MCSFIEILSIERQTEAHGNTRSKFDIVRESSNASVIDLSLKCKLSIAVLTQNVLSGSYLGKGSGVETIFACHFHADIVAAFRVPCCFGARLGLRVDLVIVRGGEDTQATRRSDSGAVLWGCVPKGQRVFGNRSFLDIIACLPANQKTVAPKDGVNICDRPLEDIEEGTGIEVGLFEVEIYFCAKFL